VANLDREVRSSETAGYKVTLCTLPLDSPPDKDSSLMLASDVKTSR